MVWLLSLLLLVIVFNYELPTDESWSAWSLPLSGTIIALDPGHGGVDGGATGKGEYASAVEKDIALNISLYLRDLLQESGALVVMTRETDKDLADPGTKGYSRRKTEDLHRRARLVNESGADFLISIHLNSFPSGKWSGAQTFYYPGRKENGDMAMLIQEEIRRTLENTSRQPKKNGTVYLLKNVDMPSVMVEVGFLSNQDEASLLTNEKYQKQMATAIYQGILRYYAGESAQSAPEN